MNKVFFCGALIVSIGLFGLVEAAALININTADKATFMTLTGIGEVKAQAIIDYRGANGPFTKIEDIKNVSGIGDVTYANIKDFITVGEATNTETEDDTAEDEEDEQETEQNETASSTTSTVVSSKSSSSSATVSLKIVGKTVGIAGANLEFEAKVVQGGSKVKNAGFRWNFGDGTVGKGEKIDHIYSHPGKYVLMLSAGSGEERITIEVLAPEFSVIGEQDGTVGVKNRSKREADIGGWFLSGNGASFLIPKATIILPGETLHFASTLTGFKTSFGVQLFYPNGVVVHTTPAATSTGGSVAAPSKSKTVSSVATGEKTDPIESPQGESLLAATAMGETGLPPMVVGFAGLGGILALGVAGALWARGQNKDQTPGSDFEIQ